MNEFASRRGPNNEPLESPFPKSWGQPPADEEQRTGWAKAKIRAGEIARASGFDSEVPWLSSSRSSATARAVARRVHQLRLRILELHRRAWS
jgi:hypothetical protein